MRARIHRGAREVGGSCVELEADGERLVLDIGRPLWAEADEEVPLPHIAGLARGDDSSLVGVAISHAHPDHCGLIHQISADVPVYIGEAASRILNEAAFFGRLGRELKPSGFLVDRESLQLGPFTVTPYLVDHSAFDAHALLVEAGGRRLLYSGDLRAHGRKPETFERLVREPPEDVDVLLMEGTRLSRAEPRPGEPTSELDVERACVEAFRATEGMVLALYSPQNVDRYVSMYKAALRSDRDLVVDLYTAAVAAATGLHETIPQADWERVKVFVPLSQRIKVKRAKAFERVNALRGSRLFPEQLAERRKRLVMTFRGSMAGDLERADCLAGASAVWSMWPGYLEDASSDGLKAFLKRHGIPLSIIHVSGHATVADLKRLAAAISADRVVPIHTDAPEEFPSLFANVEAHANGEWWAV
ncbi:MAG: MBL fold metallo-hydrolase [Actinomycetota bacterium]